MTDNWFRKMQLQKLGITSDEPIIADKEKKAPGLNKKSDKRKTEEKEYKKIVKEMLAANPNCEIKEQGCTGKAEGLHHQKKRTAGTYLDRRFLIGACNNCNGWAELHPLEAIEKGHSISKFK